MDRREQKAKAINWVTENPVKAIVLALIIAFLPLFLVLILSNYAETQKATAEQIVWIRTNLLSYFGTMLTFLGTITLSIIAVWQNKEHGQRTYELQAQIHEQEIRRQSPRFLILEENSNGNCRELILSVKNVSSQTVSSLSFTGLFGMVDGVKRDKNLLRSPTRLTRTWMFRFQATR